MGIHYSYSVYYFIDFICLLTVQTREIMDNARQRNFRTDSWVTFAVIVHTKLLKL